MRVLIQRVTEASVSIGGIRYSEIAHGLLVFLGIIKKILIIYAKKSLKFAYLMILREL